MLEITKPSTNTALEMKQRFDTIRKQTEYLCEPLQTEDFVVQPVEEVSPPKWHLAHTTWFFETFILQAFLSGYKLFRAEYPYLFNSYYIAAGDRWSRAERGHLTRPTVREIFAYRNYVNEQMGVFFDNTELTAEMKHVLEIGFQHEQQHQELLVYDFKYILGHNPLFPPYREVANASVKPIELDWYHVSGGNYAIGFEGPGFSFDNELGRHQVYLHDYAIANRLVTNGEYLAFINAGGYQQHVYWLSEGWDWVNRQSHPGPMYWLEEDHVWKHYTLQGLVPLDMDTPVSHISYYEADAYARWKGARLPTEQEWEVAVGMYQPEVPASANFVENGTGVVKSTGTNDFFGNLWEWTASSYEPYPYYQVPSGALGEYNGKFMVNQKVLRGGSCGTPRNHIRSTYRNFFHPHLQWMYGGIRLAKHV